MLYLLEAHLPRIASRITCPKRSPRFSFWVSEHALLLMIKGNLPLPSLLKPQFSFKSAINCSKIKQCVKTNFSDPRALHTVKCTTEEFLVVKFYSSILNQLFFPHSASITHSMKCAYCLPPLHFKILCSVQVTLGSLSNMPFPLIYHFLLMLKKCLLWNQKPTNL